MSAQGGNNEDNTNSTTSVLGAIIKEYGLDEPSNVAATTTDNASVAMNDLAEAAGGLVVGGPSFHLMQGVAGGNGAAADVTPIEQLVQEAGVQVGQVDFSLCCKSLFNRVS